ncbi:MAG: nucleoside hydrolase [Acidimicrobiales bacterium]
MATRPLVLDCDTGIDDALAILWLASRPDLRLVGVGTVHGNIDAGTAALNSLRVLEVAALEAPVVTGARRPLSQPLHLATAVHGEDGMGNSGQRPPSSAPSAGSAAEQLVRLAREHAGELVVLTTGPLTNLALAILLEPELPRLVSQVVVMGGAVTCPGNITPLAEANVWHDPEAAALALSSGLPLTLVGLDVTARVRLGAEELDALASGGERARFASTLLPHYLDFYEQVLGERVCLLHDPLAAVLTVEPSLASYERMVVGVDLGASMARGATVADRREGVPVPSDDPRVTVAVEVDAPSALATFMEGMLS